MLRVGLTGGIGCGKSTVAALFAQLGVPIIDTDVIAHQLTQAGGAAMPPVRKAFGDAVIGAEGALDRRAMRRRIFADEAERKELEAILHPLIRQQVEQQLASIGKAHYVIVVVPLLLETGGYRDLLDRVLVVDCSEGQQVGRAVARNGISAAEIEAIMATQASRTQRLAAADDVLENQADLTTLQAGIEALHRKYLGLSRAP